MKKISLSLITTAVILNANEVETLETISVNKKLQIQR